LSRFGLYGKITVQPGQREAMAAVLLEAARLLQDDPQCELYLVNASESEPDVIWVSEVWSSREAHSAALARDDVRALIQRGGPLIAGGERIDVVPLGGKGLTDPGGD
jgi:quinol monooxygenase YgiN